MKIKKIDTSIPLKVVAQVAQICAKKQFGPVKPLKREMQVDAGQQLVIRLAAHYSKIAFFLKK